VPVVKSLPSTAQGQVHLSSQNQQGLFQPTRAHWRLTQNILLSTDYCQTPNAGSHPGEGDVTIQRDDSICKAKELLGDRGEHSNSGLSDTKD
jgi:hypothetical protein